MTLSIADHVLRDMAADIRGIPRTPLSNHRPKDEKEQLDALALASTAMCLVTEDQISRYHESLYRRTYTERAE